MAKTEATVTRTFRTAIRCGEDFITIEETIVLPVGASDDQIAEAIDTGLRIYRAQQIAVEQQAQLIRDQNTGSPRILDPDAPASEKQRSFLDALIQSLSWSTEQRNAYLSEHGAAYDTLTKGQASQVIDQLKTQVDSRRDGQGRQEQTNGRQEQAAGAPAAPAAATERSDGTPASERQLKALENLARANGFDLTGELRSRYGLVDPADLSASEAAALLKEFQAAQRRR